VIFSNY